MADVAQTGKKVAYKDIREYLALLESKGLLHRIKKEVDLKWEIGAISARSLARGGPALLFENVKGYPGLPLVANLICTTEQVALAFGTEPREDSIHRAVVDGMNNRIASVEVSSEQAPCQEVVVEGDDVDIFAIPTPWWHELDGGQYLGTTAGCVTRDPITGILNMGTYRVMIKDKNTLTMAGGIRRGRDPSAGLGGGDHIMVNEKDGMPTPIAVVMGMDPLLTLASGSPVRLGAGRLEGSMEYEAAGGWRGAPTELVKCKTSDLLIPAWAEFVVEGEALPRQRAPEGPHGESTGFYGEQANAFVIKIKAITHRKNPVTYGLICQRVEDYPRQLLRSASMQYRLIAKTGMANIKAVYFPEVGRFGMLIVAADITRADEPRRIMEAIWNTEPWRWIVIVDEDCDVRDWNEVMWRVVSAAQPERDCVMGRVLSAQKPEGEKDFVPPNRGIGIDATMRFKPEKFPAVNKVSKRLMDEIAGKWREYGLS